MKRYAKPGLSGWIMQVLLLVVALVPRLAGLESDALPRASAVEREMLEQVNKARQEEGLEPLKWNPRLSKSAEAHLQWIRTEQTLSHRFPDEPALRERVAASGLRFDKAAENVAFATDAEDLHPSLMKSPGHRANILSPKYNAIGIAVTRTPKGYYAVQNFAHTTSEYDSEETEARFAAAFRKLNGSRRVEIVSSRAVRRAACEMLKSDKIDAKKLPIEKPNQASIAYTAVEPEDLPPAVVELTKVPGLTALEVGACYGATESYPGGVYWFALIH